METILFVSGNGTAHVRHVFCLLSRADTSHCTPPLNSVTRGFPGTRRRWGPPALYPTDSKVGVSRHLTYNHLSDRDGGGPSFSWKDSEKGGKQFPPILILNTVYPDERLELCPLTISQSVLRVPSLL